MKTTVCDICGKTQEDLYNQMARVRRYKVSTWHRAFNADVLENVDICDLCVKRIREEMRNGGKHDY